MGWSCTKLALYAQETMLALRQAAIGNAGGSSNGWGASNKELEENPSEKSWFFECGRENTDGAITGAVYESVSLLTSRKIGSVRIESNGTVTRWPTSTAQERKLATETAQAKFGATYGADALTNALSF